jgi:hypothetical protein
VVGVEVSREKTKFKFMIRHQNAGQNYDVMITNKTLENVAVFIHLGATVTNQEIKSRLSSGDACYLSVQNSLLSHLLSKDLKISYNFTCFSHGCETWFLILRKEHRLRVFENRELRRI